MYFSNKPAKEEYSMLNQERIISEIDRQLEGIDIESIRAKEDLILEKTMEELQENISENKLSYVELTAFYLDRIKNIDQIDSGINGISEINPMAIKEAIKLDKENNKQSNLYGMPITIKENINTDNMVTSVGTHILRDFIPNEDAELVKRLKEENAIILGKTNLSELANFVGRKMPSGYSSKHGQTLNPFNPLELTPSGSSSGSGASITTNIGVASIGTETTGSIIAPASVESIVGFKPSHGNVSGEGIFPLAPSLDVAGPMGRTVIDAIEVYNSITTNGDTIVDIDNLDSNILKNKKIGIISTKSDMEDKAIELLKNIGVEVVNIEMELNDIDNVKIINNELKFAIEEFSNKYNLPFNTLKELVDYNDEDLEIRAKYGQDLLEDADDIKEKNQAEVDKMINLVNTRYENAISENNLDSIVYIDGDGVIITAVAGLPQITVPIGLDSNGIPHGLTFTSLKNEDKKLLEYAYSFEQNTKLRKVLSDKEIMENINKK